MSFLRRNATTVGLAAVLVLASLTGYLAATAFSASNAAAVTTVTISVKNGATGPTGPQGPAGPAGAVACPEGYDDGDLVINAPGGQTTIRTCIKK